MVGALKDWDRRADIGKIQVPTYLTFGAHETMPLTAAKRMAATIPDATLHITPGAGHGRCSITRRITSPRWASG